MATRLIRNGFVVTVNQAREVFPGGYVVTDGNRIAEVGPGSRCPSVEGFDQVVDAEQQVVLPGFINAHQHDWYGLFKGIADGLLLEDWVTEILLPLAGGMTPDLHRLGGLTAGIEMLATGTTCSLNHSVTSSTEEDVGAMIQAQLDLGIRHVFAKDMRCRTSGHPDHPLSLHEALAAFEQQHARWQGAGDGLVQFAMALESNAHWVAAGMSTEELILEGRALAGRLGLQITAHIAGGTFSLEKGFLKYLRETGRTDVRYLMQLGVLDRNWVLAHGIHVTEVDLEHMARTGASLAYTPSSESIRGGGIGPASNALRAGVNVALGTDGPMVDYSNDMLEQVKICALMQHNRHLDPQRVPPETAVEMATINSARALNLDDRIGSLEAGKLADIAIFDLSPPHVGIVHRPISSLVCAGRGSDASHVFVNGELVYSNGALTCGIDPISVRAEAASAAGELLQKTGLSARMRPPWRTKPEAGQAPDAA